MPGAGSLAKCQCCCVDRLCSRGENRGTAPQLDGAVRHETCRTAFSCCRSYRVAARLSKNLVAFAPAGAKKVQSFSSATCAAKKILLRLQVWNLCAAGAQIMRAADCKPLCQKVILFDSLKKAAAPVGAAALTFFCSVNWRAAAPRGARAAAATAAAAKTRPSSPRRCPDAAAACRRRTRANSTRR